MLKKNYLLGVGITSERKADILEWVLQSIAEGKKKLFIVTPNPEILVYAQKHLAYKDKLNSASVSLPDGIGVILASRLLGLGIAERMTGVDFIEKLCETSREKPLSMGFLGGRSNVAERTAECLKAKYPWLSIVFISEEWGEEGFVRAANNSKLKTQKSKLQFKNQKDFSPLISHFSSPMDILFVAYGFPKQEEWIYDNLDKLPVKAAIGVGGAFDYISGAVPRAPKVMRALGLEWFFRLMVQPWRLKRQFAIITFLLLVAKQVLAKK